MIKGLLREAQANTQNGDCTGLMQINHRYHTDRMERLGVSDLYNWQDNIKVGVDYLAELFEKYEDPYLVLMVYNGTSDPVKKWNEGNFSKYAVEVAKLAYNISNL